MPIEPDPHLPDVYWRLSGPAGRLEYRRSGGNWYYHSPELPYPVFEFDRTLVETPERLAVWISLRLQS